MLSAGDTLARTFAAVSHRHRDRPALVAAGQVVTWAQLGASVRRLALGLDTRGVGPGSRVRVEVADPSDRRSLELALTCLGAVRAAAADEPGGAGTLAVEDHDVAPLRAAGARLDAGDPDRFERHSRCVGADTPAVTDGTATWTQRQLLWAAHSLATSLGATVEDRVLSALPAEGVTGWVCGALLPIVSGAASIDPVGARPPAGPGRPTLLVCRDEDVAGFGQAGAGGARGRWRRLGRPPGRPPGLEDCRAAVVVGGGAGAERLAVAGVPARAAVTWPGHAGLVTGAAGPPGGLGHPLPGVTIGIDDDGEVLVRSASVSGGCGRDGWLRTGWQGRIDEAGRLFATTRAASGDG